MRISTKRLNNAIDAYQNKITMGAFTGELMEHVLLADDSFRSTNPYPPDAEPALPEGYKAFIKDDHLWVDNGMCWSVLPKIPSEVFLAAYLHQLGAERQQSAKAKAVEVPSFPFAEVSKAAREHLERSQSVSNKLAELIGDAIALAIEEAQRKAAT